MTGIGYNASGKTGSSLWLGLLLGLRLDAGA